MANRKLIVEIVGDSRSLERSLARSTNSAQKFKVGLGTIFKGAVGFLAVQKGADLAGDAVRAGISEFTEMTKVTAQTNAALKSTGRVANVTAKQVTGLAQQLSRMSGIDDELIQSGENLILTFKNVRNEAGKGNDIFNRATRSALDLSVRGFGSIETTSKALGKALNDPVRGMTALRRVGVTFTRAQEDAVKKMVATNDILGAQKIILGQVESQVGGSARALGETLPGKLNILRETFNNLAGSIVQRFEPSIKRAVDRVVDWLSKTRNQQRVQKAINDVVKTASTIVGAFVDALKTLKDILDPVIDLVGGLKNAVKLLIGVMVASKVANFATAIAGVGTSAKTSAGQTVLLKTALRRLALIGAIAIPIEVFLNRKQITDEFNKLTDKLPKWAQGGGTIRIDAGKSIAELRALRKKLEGMSGDNREAIALIDAQIKKLRAKPIPRSATLPFGPDGRTSRTRTTSSLSASRPVVESHVTIQMDSDVVAKHITRSQQKTGRRNPPQKRGMHPGI